MEATKSSNKDSIESKTELIFSAQKLGRGMIYEYYNLIGELMNLTKLAIAMNDSEVPVQHLHMTIEESLKRVKVINENSYSCSQVKET